MIKSLCMPDLDGLKRKGPKGQGYFCIVTQYTDENTGKNYAVKELKKEHYSNEDRSFLCEYYYSPTSFHTSLFFQTPPNQSLFQFGYVSVPESV